MIQAYVIVVPPIVNVLGQSTVQAAFLMHTGMMQEDVMPAHRIVSVPMRKNVPVV